MSQKGVPLFIRRLQNPRTDPRISPSGLPLEAGASPSGLPLEVMGETRGPGVSSMRKVGRPREDGEVAADEEGDFRKAYSCARR